MLLGPFMRLRVSPSLLGYILVGLGLTLAVLLPSTLVGLPWPEGYVLSNYSVIPDVPLVPLLGIALGASTVWSVHGSTKMSRGFVILSCGFLLTLGLFWVTAAGPGTHLRGLGFPMSWILVLDLPLRPPQVLGTSIIAFLGDLSLWTVFIDSLLFALQKNKMRHSYDRLNRPH
jgi:hypothetical protein